tara:strand:- start:1754 stop:2566 length:813 start_codon:yes stop_codon:yes gene_type:complete
MSAPSHVFPKDYGKAESTTVPMVGFGACEILEGSGVSSLDLSPPKEWAWLPIPTEGISTGYQQGWQESSVNMMAAAADKGISEIIKYFGAGGQEKQGGRTDREGGQSTNSGVLNVDSVGGAIEEMMKGKGGLATGITKRALEQTYVSYSGPTYRPHSFSFSLKPKSHDDSLVIQDLIKFFKIYSAPESLGGVAEILRLYKTPHLFDIKFLPNNSKQFPLIGASALTDFQVKYGGDKFIVFDDDDMPSQVDISLSFKEMIILDLEKIKEGY